MFKKFITERIKIIAAVLSASALIFLLDLILSNIVNIRYLFPYLKKVYIVLIVIFLIIYITSLSEKLRVLGRIIKITSIISVIISIILFTLSLLWYNYCFFPDDEDYLKIKVNESVYTNDELQDVELDLIRKLNKAVISSPLDKKDMDYLLNPEFKEKDIYIDYNPYNSVSMNNLKYATGRTDYYVYQKNCMVIKENSRIEFKLLSSKNMRFVELDIVFPSLESGNDEGEFSVYFRQNKGQMISLVNEKIQKGIKPDIKLSGNSGVLSSILFYLNHRGRSVITDNTGWKKIKAGIPADSGTLVLEFKTKGTGKNYLFTGTPRVYSVKEKDKGKHYNLVYIIFDTLGQSHIDLYNYYDDFIKNGFENAVDKIGRKNIITENIDSYYDRIILFDNVMTAGHVTRPAIMSLWTSQFFTKMRMPVISNIVTRDNQKEFYEQGFTTLGEKLSGLGYLTKQIACNVKSHNVSGAGADLGFDENHDYTMETSEHSANIKYIISFLNENQNRKFFLCTHLNMVNSAGWIPAKYLISELSECNYNLYNAKMRGNIRYADFNFKIIMDTIRKLKLDENTFVVVTAGHGSGEPDQIPFIVIPPKSFKTQKARIKTYISGLDIAPTLLELLKGQKEKFFSGASFKYLFDNPYQQKKVHCDFIPMTGRFSSGFILKGKYKYRWDMKSIDKCITDEKGVNYFQKPEHLYNLEDDPNETINLANDEKNYGLLNEMRNLRLTKFQDYDEKNYIQLAPDDKINGNIRIQVNTDKGKIIYPLVYGEGVKINRKSDKEIEFTSANSKKFRFIIFETKPDKVSIKINIYRNNVLIDKQHIFSGMEKLNIFNNPVIINNEKDFFITSIQGRTGLEEVDLPAGSVYYYRIPLIYWLERGGINLSTRNKEVLKGWDINNRE